MSKEEMILRTPLPPSVNHYYVHARGRMFISKIGQAYRVTVRQEIEKLRQKPMTGKLAIDIHLYPPDRRRRDVDNALKAMLDALQHGGAYPDDTAIHQLRVEKHEPSDDPHAVICITNI